MLDDNCELCALVNGDIKTRVYWDNELSICVDCLTCRIPMVVIKRHDREMNETEKVHIEGLIKDVFGSSVDFVRKEPRKILVHAHWHVILK